MGATVILVSIDTYGHMTEQERFEMGADYDELMENQRQFRGPREW